MSIRNTLGERELDKFVESPTRSGKTAVEIVGEITIDTAGLATAENQDEQTVLLTSIDNKVSTAAKQDTGNNSLSSIDGKVSTLAEQQTQTTALNNIYARLLLILNAILGVLNIRPLTFLTDKVDASGSSVSVSNFPANQNVTVTSSVLPTGAATSALQTAGNSILTNILAAIQGVLNIRNLVFATDKVDVSGSTVTATIGGITKEQTYSAAVVDITVANLATDIFTIQGSNTKKIKVVHISVNGTQQNLSKVNILIVKRSTLNTLGTFAVVVGVPHCSANAAATAIVKSYSANPTLGTFVGIVQAEKVTIGSVNGINISNDDLVFEFGRAPEQEIILENENEMLAVNLNGVTLNTNLMTLDIRWTEV